ncbi:hypothetical protein ICNINCKA_01830 [Synechococcus sp. CBW1107]|nr:hypothetical protein ICNINCKA_01830 [Synechococcus sp. CBW1107]
MITEASLRSLDQLPAATREAIVKLGTAAEVAGALADVPGPIACGAGAKYVEKLLTPVRRAAKTSTEEVDELVTLLRRPYRLMVAGPSQAGKSTLINVLCGLEVLKMGGFGQARTLKETSVTYSASDSATLRVSFHSKRTVSDWRLRLDNFARRVLGGEQVEEAVSVIAHVESGDPDLALSEETRDYSDNVVIEGQDDVLRLDIERIKAIVYPETKHKGTELDPAVAEEIANVRDHEWADAYRILLGNDTLTTLRFEESWRSRLAGPAKLLGTELCLSRDNTEPEKFDQLVEDYTAGGYSFLVEGVEVAVPEADFQLMDVVDLPGVGNFNDPAGPVAREVMRRAMRERSLDGLLIVLKQNGLDDAVAELLRETKVLERVMEGQTDFGVAVGFLDQMAVSREADLERKNEEVPEPDELLTSLASEVEKTAREALSTLVKEEAKRQDDPDEGDETAENKASQVLEKSHFFAVDTQGAYAHRFNRGRRRSYSESLEESRVPAILSRYSSFAESRHQKLVNKVQLRTETIRTSVLQTLETVLKRCEADALSGVSAEVSEAYRQQLHSARGPLAARWVEFRASRNVLLEADISKSSFTHRDRARRLGAKKNQAVIASCRSSGPRGNMISHNTLKAALRRGGVWTGGAHYLNLPEDLTHVMLPEFLAGWRAAKSHLEQTLELHVATAREILSDLSRLASEAASSVGLETRSSNIDDVCAELTNLTENVAEVLGTRQDVIGETIREQLRKELGEHFEDQCKRVVDSDPGGTGTTQRLLQAYSDIGVEAVEKGAEVGAALLERVVGELITVYRKRLLEDDPVARGYTALLERLEDADEAQELEEARTSLQLWTQKQLETATSLLQPTS